MKNETVKKAKEEALKIASEIGVRLNEADTIENLKEKRDWNDYVASRKKELPEMESQYVSSGKTVEGTEKTLIWATVAGIPLGVLATVVTAAIVIGLCFLLGKLTVTLSEIMKGLACLSALVLIPIGLGGGALMLAMPGIAPAGVLFWFSKRIKNRNMDRVSNLSMLCAAVVIAVFVTAYLLTKSALPADAILPTGWLITSIVVMLLFSLAGAGVTTANLFGSAKFCEKCEVYMESHPLKSISLADVKIVKHALEADNWQAVYGVFQNVKRGNSKGYPTLFYCPQCGDGYLEIEYGEVASVPAPRPDAPQARVNRDEKWLVVSVATNKAQSNMLKNFNSNQVSVDDAESVSGKNDWE